jgi:hypothetical protein
VGKRNYRIQYPSTLSLTYYSDHRKLGWMNGWMKVEDEVRHFHPTKASEGRRGSWLWRTSVIEDCNLRELQSRDDHGAQRWRSKAPAGGFN